MKKLVPTPQDVPLFAKAGPETLKRHLVVEHGAMEMKGMEVGKAIQVHFPKMAPMECRVALMLCMNPTIPFSIVDDPFFIQAFGKEIDRQSVVICLFSVRVQ